MPVRDGGYASIVLRAAAALALVAWVAEGAAEWPTFRADIGRTGRAEQALSENPSVLWACDLGGSVDGSPVVLDQRVFVGNSHGRFACVAAADGKLLWDTHLDGAVCSAAAADGQRIVVGTSRGFLYCLSPGGKMLWRLHCWDAVVASPLILGDRCFWGSMDGVLHCAALASGQELWTCQLSGGISAAPASDGKVIFVADEAGDIWAIRPSDGSIVWRYQSECPAMAAPVFESGELTVALVSPTRLAPPKVPYLVVLDAASGKPKWQVIEARSIFASPILLPGAVVYVSVEGYLSATFLRCHRRTDGVELWRQQIGGVVDSSPAVADAKAYFGAHDGCLYAVDAATGQVQARLRLAPKIFSSPALVEGRLYIGASDGRLYCIK